MRQLILLRVIESYFRHRWLHLLPVFLMLNASVFYFLTQERVYISQGVIFVQKESYLASLTSVRSDGFSWNTPAQDTTTEISDLTRTDAFIRAVIRETTLEQMMSQGNAVIDETIYETRNSVWAIPTGANQVSIYAKNVDPRIAQQLAIATINNYIRWKINSDQAESSVAEEFFGLLIEQYKAEVEQAQDALKQYLTDYPGPLRGDRPELEQLEVEHLRGELEVAGTRLASAMQKEESARLATSQVETDVRQTYFMIDAPEIPEKPSTSRRQLAMNAAIYLVIGIILSIVGIVGSAILDRSLRFPADVVERLHLPLLTIVPDIRERKKWYQKVLPKKKTRPAMPVEIKQVRKEVQDASLWIDALQTNEDHNLEMAEPDTSVDVMENKS